MAKSKSKDSVNDLNEKISARLRYAIDNLDYTQSDVITMCEKRGYTLSRSALSKMLSEKSPSGFTLTNITIIAEILELDLNQLLSTSEDKKIDLRVSKSETFISSYDNDLLKNYIGNYHLMMYPTISDETEPITGLLSISKSKKKTDLSVYIKISVPRDFTQNSNIQKEYWGPIRLSTKMRALYIVASNESIGEDVFIILPFFVLEYEQMYSRIGLALVNCAGVNRIPTAQRILVTKKKITEIQKKYVYGHLLLNRADIRISIDKFNEMICDEDLPSSFKSIFVDDNKELKGAIKTTYYHISESTIRGTEMNRSDRIKSISLLRYYSDSKRYTKVSNKANEILYRLLNETDEQQCQNSFFFQEDDDD